MTVPTFAAEASVVESPEQPPVSFPLRWLLEHATPALQYRAIVDVAGGSIAAEPGTAFLPYATPSTLRLACMQEMDETWNHAMLSVPSRAGSFTGVGTINAVRRLLESGWDRESPPLARARRVLFRLLAEDNDPAYLFELSREAKRNERAVRARSILREAAAAALAQGGYEADPRLRGAARRMMERIDAFLDSALAEKPWVRIGNQHVLAAEATPPSIYALTMFAYMPIFRSEHYPEMERLYAYLCQTQPRQEVVQLYGSEIIGQPHLVLGDMLGNRNVVDADVPFALMWLETMARLGFLNRNENWLRMFDRLLDDRDRHGVWHPHKGTAAPTSTNPHVWPMFPLEDGTGPEGKWTDVTFRIGLIAKLAGRRIELI